MGRRGSPRQIKRGWRRTAEARRWVHADSHREGILATRRLVLYWQRCRAREMEIPAGR